MSDAAPPQPLPILWVDDELHADSPSVQLLKVSGFRVTVARTGAEALQIARRAQCAGIILDLSLPDVHGLDVLACLRDGLLEAPTVVVTGYGSIRAACEATRLGALDFIEKPLVGEALLSIVSKLLAAAAYNPSVRLREVCELLSVARTADRQGVLAKALIREGSGWLPCLLEVTRLRNALSPSSPLSAARFASSLDSVDHLEPLVSEVCCALERCAPLHWRSAAEAVWERHRVSRRDFRMAVTRGLGYSWPQIHARLRLRACLVRITAEREHVRQVAFAMGYPHATELNRHCRDFLGVTPTKFRELALGGSQ